MTCTCKLQNLLLTLAGAPGGMLKEHLLGAREGSNPPRSSGWGGGGARTRARAPAPSQRLVRLLIPSLGAVWPQKGGCWWFPRGRNSSKQPVYYALDIITNNSFRELASTIIGKVQRLGLQKMGFKPSPPSKSGVLPPL